MTKLAIMLPIIPTSKAIIQWIMLETILLFVSVLITIVLIIPLHLDHDGIQKIPFFRKCKPV